ncbi:MAG: rhodanese-like domain-containing protein [Fimbriimonadaceae bacterium]|jgi:rhodanese-related sulfurtransferase|nr:rhodanese-like domain-containing protein [Fimbriimonadaceae bacterium]
MAKTLNDFVSEALLTVREIEPGQLADLTDTLILDVREPEEYGAGHVPGSINIPRGFLEVKADHSHPKKDDRLQDRNLKIACLCGGGHRSALAAKTLMEMGFRDVLSVKGGWAAYCESNLPTES